MRQTTETRDAARHRHPRDRQQACVPKGLSLVEVVISTLLVGLLAVEAMRSVGAVFQSRAATAKGLDGIGLSHHLISEVVQSHYEDPDETPAFGREPGEAQTLSNRADFDDVDDYHGWSSTSLQLEDGTPIAGYAGWRRDVTITFADPDNPTGNSSSDLDLKRITVTVTDPDNTQTVLVAFRSRWGLLEQEPPLDASLITGIGGELQIGSNAAKAILGTRIANHAEDQ